MTDSRTMSLEALICAVLFAIAHTQAPLFFSNQNQYLLHGLANAGLGNLHNDWLAQTADPTPTFSWLVSHIFSLTGAFGLHAAFFLLLMIYFLSMRVFIQALPGIPQTRSFRIAFAALFTALHSALFRVISVAASGVDYPWFFQSGLAGQYLLGPGLQPSCFGICIVTGLALVARNRVVLGCALASISAAMHTTYALPAGSFVLFVVLWSLWNRRTRSAILASFAAIVIVSPNFIYTMRVFSPVDSASFLEAHQILATIRIPHHCMVRRWLDGIAGLQIIWIAFGLLMLRRTSIFPVLAALAGLGVLLTLAQVATANSTFALFFPWRISVVLVPISTAVILAKLIAREKPRLAVTFLAATSLCLLALGGILLMVEKRGYAMDERELPLYRYAREQSQSNDVYLLPSRIPQVSKGRGVKSATFVMPKWNQIPVNLQRFRLLSGQPIYVDFKSVPYRDIEVIEWYRRIRLCENWYGDWHRAGVRNELNREGITRVVAPHNRPIVVPFLESIYSDGIYIIYQVK